MTNEIPTHIYHYYERKKGPFMNISNQPYQKAKKILDDIKVGFNSKRPDDYLDQRILLEQKLKSAFIEKGGRPTRNDPFYFTLGPCEWLETWYEDTAIIEIPLELFKDCTHISFTFPDSMISYQIAEMERFSKYRNPYNGKVLLKEEIITFISIFGLPSKDKWAHIPEQQFNRYIEVQVWDDSIIHDFLGQF